MIRWLILLLSTACLAQAEQTRKPNIILIVADDLGYGDLGCYGSRINPTPEIDGLAATGLRFTDFHTAGAMCSPTRASILTGKYPQRFGAQFDGALSGTSQRDAGLPLEAVTIAEFLRDRGYATGCFGKWHLGYQPPMLPTRQGFDTFRGLVSGDGDFHSHIDRSGREDWWLDEEIDKQSGYTTDLLTRAATDFIEAHRDSPMFVYLPHLAIHFPWQGPDDPPQRTSGKSWHKDKWGIIPNPANVAPHITSMIASMDDSVGKIRTKIRTLDLEKDTLIIFTSDNGGYLNYGKKFQNISSNGPYRGQKTELYEGGHRVPLIVSWPGKIEPGVSAATIHSNDFFPTLAGLVDPDLSADRFDGNDFAPLWLNGEPPSPRPLFWRSRSQFAVRSGPWKLVGKRANPEAAELYRLDKDPGESEDIASLHPDKRSQLVELWENWNQRVEDSADSN